MIAKVRNSEALRALARCYKYRKHDVIISDYDSVELTGGFWDGGSRSCYSLFTPPDKIESIHVDRNPPQFGGAPVRSFPIPRGSYVVEGGIFRGKRAHLHIYGIGAVAYFTGSAAQRYCGLCAAPLQGERCEICDRQAQEIVERGRS